MPSWAAPTGCSPDASIASRPAFRSRRRVRTMLAKTEITGNPVRPAVVAVAAAAPARAGRAVASARDGRLAGRARHGGRRAASDRASVGGGARPHRLVQQARDEDLARSKAAYDALGFTAELAPFFADLPQRIAEADLVIARAGASTVSELAVIGRRGDPRALSARARRGPGRQCRRTRPHRGGRCRAAEGFHAGVVSPRSFAPRSPTPPG